MLTDALRAKVFFVRWPGLSRAVHFFTFLLLTLNLSLRSLLLVQPDGFGNSRLG